FDDSGFTSSLRKRASSADHNTFRNGACSQDTGTPSRTRALRHTSHRHSDHQRYAATSLPPKVNFHGRRAAADARSGHLSEAYERPDSGTPLMQLLRSVTPNELYTPSALKRLLSEAFEQIVGAIGRIGTQPNLQLREALPVWVIVSSNNQTGDAGFARCFDG